MTFSFELNIFKHDTRNTTMTQLLRALRLMMKFVDTHYYQINGTAIGSVPASDWVTKMFNFCEVAIIEPTFRQNLRLDTRFVDDKIGIWRSHRVDDYNEFKTTMNNMCKLELIASLLSKNTVHRKKSRVFLPIAIYSDFFSFLTGHNYYQI